MPEVTSVPDYAMMLDRATDIGALLHEHALLTPDRPAVILAGNTRDTPDDRLSYARLNEAAERIAETLRRRCQRGDRVLLLYPNGLGFAAAFLGCLGAGLVAVPAPVPGRSLHQRRRLATIAADAGVTLLLTDTAEVDAVTDWMKAADVDLPLLLPDTAPSHTGLSVTEPVEPSTGPTEPVGRDSIALLQYTSGSTGEPKGVVVTHGNLLCNTATLMRAFRPVEPLRLGGWIPMFHDMGLIGHLMLGLLGGGGVVLLTPMAFLRRPHRWLELISDYRIAVSAAPDFGYERCVRQVTDEQIDELDLSSWRFACNGSEPVRGEVLRAFAERFARAGFDGTSFFPCYGLAEATLFVSGTGGRAPVIDEVAAELLEKDRIEPPTAQAGRRQLVSMGVSVGDTQVRVVAPDRRVVLPDGCVGEIWVRGGSVAHGYWGNDTATEDAFRACTADGDGPFLRTGDLGALVEGELYVTGRIKDVLVIDGRNLYPNDIEDEIGRSHPEVAGLTGAAFTVDERHGGLVVVHEVRGKHDDRELRRLSLAMRSTVVREFGVYAVGVVLVAAGVVPRTTSGKVQRRLMRRMFLAGCGDVLYANLSPALSATRGAS